MVLGESGPSGVPGGVPGGDPPRSQMATAAGSTHPTGMHSCSRLFFYEHYCRMMNVTDETNVTVTLTCSHFAID